MLPRPLNSGVGLLRGEIEIGESRTMSELNRRDFLLHLAPLASVPLLLSAEDAFGQFKQLQQMRLLTPKQNQSFSVGEQVQIAVLIKTPYLRLMRVDFRANGQLIGSGSGRTARITGHRRKRATTPSRRKRFHWKAMSLQPRR